MQSASTGSSRLSLSLILLALACIVAAPSCVNPFAVDTSSAHPDDGLGGNTMVSLGMGGRTGSGGAVATGAGGSTSAGGSTGTPDAGPDVASAPLPVQPLELFPTIPQCPADIVDEEDPNITCPRSLTEIVEWLPVTPPMDKGAGCLPLPHPAGECQFYQQSFQEFMLATQPDNTGKPAFLGWNTIENTFGAGAGKPTPAIPVLTAGVTQAGGRQIVIDQNGHALYYGIHMNPAFVKFVNDAHLTSADQIKRADPSIHFITTSAIVETKEAWMIIPDAGPQTATFVTTRAMVPTLSVDPQLGVVADDNNLRQVTVALIAIHIVHTIPGHPEFVWSTFQHADRMTGVTDLAPSSVDLPRNNPPNVLGSIGPQPAAGGNYLLYTRNTLPMSSNQGVFVPQINAAMQTFTTPPTSIYRVFPAAKTATTEIDGDITLLNTAMQDRFNTVQPPPAANDRRPWYRLVGAVWLDRPANSFFVNKVLVNNPLDAMIIEEGSDAINSINGGEDGLSSTAMESFTQGPSSFPTCFSCHVPQPKNPSSPVVMQPGLINVSHIFNEVVRLNIN